MRQVFDLVDRIVRVPPRPHRRPISERKRRTGRTWSPTSPARRRRPKCRRRLRHADIQVRLICEWGFSALPVLTYSVRSAPVLEIRHFRRGRRFLIQTSQATRPTKARGCNDSSFRPARGGRIGKVHARAITLEPDRRSWWRLPTRSEGRRRTLPTPMAARFARSRRSRRPSDIDAVVICTPTDTHADLIERFSKAGKAMFCEKPIDLDVKRVSKLPVGCREDRRDADGRLQPPFRSAFRGGAQGDRRRRHRQGREVTITSRDPGPPPRRIHHAARAASSAT